MEIEDVIGIDASDAVLPVLKLGLIPEILEQIVERSAPTET